MKLRWTIQLVGLLLVVSAGVMAQVPLGINYQGVARSADGSPLINQDIGLRISITNGPDGSADYVEEHHPLTNEFGLFAVVIGQGQSGGSIGDVDWAAGNKWLQIEIDPQDNGNYMLVGTQQMMSVPYALYAGNAATLTPGYGIEINNGQINNVLPDQIINLNGTGATTITGTYPNFTINTTDNVDDADADPANEIQTLSKTGNTVTLSNGGGSFTDAVDDADNDPTNEIELPATATTNQVLKWNGTAWVAGTDETADSDADNTNELLQGAVLTGTNLELTDAGGTRTVDLSSLQDGTGTDNQDLSSVASGTNRTINITGGTGTTFSIADNDNDATNEIQDLQLAGDNLTITNNAAASTIDLSGYLDNTDNQNLSSTISGTNRTINISGGTGTTIDVADNDNDATNELQDISTSGAAGNISLSGGSTLNLNVNDADANPTNEIQDLQLTGNNLTITNNAAPTTIDLSGYLDNTDNQNLSSTISGTNRTINISGGIGTTIDVADNDNDATNELQDISTSGAAGNISLSSGSTLTLNVNDADADATNEIQNLNQVLTQGNDAGNNRITNLADPIDPQDAVNLQYLEQVDATDFAFKTNISEASTGTAFAFDLTNISFDEGSLIAGTQININEPGVYIFFIEGETTQATPANIEIRVNGVTGYPLRVFLGPVYFDRVFVKLNAGDYVELWATNPASGESFTIEFFGYKI